jgi:hypothetical protein
MGVPSKFKTKVVGVTFVKGYPNNIFRLNDIAAERFLTTPAGFGQDVEPEPLPAVLIRNPANEFDANAIEVHVPSLGDPGMIGHIPRTVAERLAPSLDAGDPWLSFITYVAIDPNHPNNPGVHIEIERSGEEDPF